METTSDLTPINLKEQYPYSAPKIEYPYDCDECCLSIPTNNNSLDGYKYLHQRQIKSFRNKLIRFWAINYLFPLLYFLFLGLLVGFVDSSDPGYLPNIIGIAIAVVLSCCEGTIKMCYWKRYPTVEYTKMYLYGMILIWSLFAVLTILQVSYLSWLLDADDFSPVGLIVLYFVQMIVIDGLWFVVMWKYHSQVAIEAERIKNGGRMKSNY